MNQGYRNLMLGVMASQIDDYFNEIITQNLTRNLSGKAKTSRKQELERHGRSATEWIKSEENIYIFSFHVICKHVDVDPAKLRKKILAIDTPDLVFRTLERKNTMEPFGSLLSKSLNRTRVPWYSKKES